MIESQQVLEWMAMREINTRIDSLLEVLATRFPLGSSPDREAVIRSTTDREQLRGWLLLALKAKSLEAFRQAADL